MEHKNIWAFGGGKGGVGKSFVAGNLGILLAQNGHSVILADLDLGGANMHTWLGVNSPKKSISEFIEREEQDIKKKFFLTSIRKNLKNLKKILKKIRIKRIQSLITLKKNNF